MTDEFTISGISISVLNEKINSLEKVKSGEISADEYRGKILADGKIDENELAELGLTGQAGGESAEDDKTQKTMSPKSDEVTVQKWGSSATDGNKYANDCLSRIIANHYSDIKLYSSDYDKLLAEIEKMNNIGKYIYDGDILKLPTIVYDDEGNISNFMTPEEVAKATEEAQAAEVAKATEEAQAAEEAQKIQAYTDTATGGNASKTDTNQQATVAEDKTETSETSTISDADAEILVMRLNKAVYGAGTDEDLINSILGNNNLTSADINLLAEKYEAMYEQSLGDAIKNDTSGVYEDALIAILDSAKNGSNNKDLSPGQKAAKIYKAIKGIGTDEDAVFSIICDVNMSKAEFKELVEIYEQVYGSLEDAIKGDFSGDTEKLLLVRLEGLI